MECISCKKEGSILLPSLELRTLNVRDMRGHDRYQVPDDEVKTCAVCRDCAERYIRDGSKRAARKLLIFGVLLAAGIALAAFFLGRDRVILVLGLAAIFCGAAGVYTTLRERKAEKEALSGPKALERAAWQVFLRSAPTQMEDGVWRLSYIPVNEETLTTKPGDLTVIYGIKNEVAKEVMLKIGHPQA